jgi:hypothetical protein
MSSSTLRASVAAIGKLQRLPSSIAKRTFAASSDENLVKTALNDLHKELGGDMVPFAGYELPVLYKGENGGVMKEHLWCREDDKVAMFDVSHMGQVGRQYNDSHCTTKILSFRYTNYSTLLCSIFKYIYIDSLAWSRSRRFFGKNCRW